MLALILIVSCTNENDLIDVSSVNAPGNISALTTVTQDNTGKVTFLPRGEGVTRYEIFMVTEQQPLDMFPQVVL